MRAALYVRVSTADQDLEHQEADLRRELERRGWELAELYRETVSGVAVRRPELERLRQAAAMSRFRAVLVWSIDRIGRNALEVLQVAEELYGRGVALVSFREPAVDLTNPMGRLVLEIGAAFAGFERRRLSERTRSGMAGARARGKRIGRPRKVNPDQVAHLWRLNNGGIALTAQQLGVGETTVRRALKASGARQGPPKGEGQGTAPSP